jgi:uncharacterized membrane protein
VFIVWKQVIIDLFNNNRGKCIGAFIGLIIGIFVLTIGFFKTLFLVICIFLGYYFGKKVDNKESIIEIIERILPDEWK